MKPPIVIISAPSGAGKNSFVERIIDEYPVLFDTITYTTREMRSGESEGNPYHFISPEQFQNHIDNGFFVEWAKVHSNYYGTSRQQLEEAWERGQVVIMDVDIQGARTFKQKYPESASIFILPPSLDELRRRIEKRDGALPKDFELRMANAEKEIASAGEFDHQVTNDEFEPSYQEFKKIVAKLLEEQ